MPSDVDYITVPTSQISDSEEQGIAFSNMPQRTPSAIDINKVPMMFSITVDLAVQKTPKQLRDDFSLQKLKSGKLLQKRGKIGRAHV